MFLSPCQLLPLLKVYHCANGNGVKNTEWLTDLFSLGYSDQNKKNIFNYGGNNGHWLKKRYVQTDSKRLYGITMPHRYIDFSFLFSSPFYREKLHIVI